MKQNEVKSAQDRVLELVAETCHLLKSLRLAGVATSTHYYWIETQPEYRARYREAVKQGSDALVGAAVERAVDGVDEPVYQGGGLVGHKRKYSDSLLAILLKAHRPEFKESTKSEVTFTDTASGLDLTKLSDEKYAQFKQLLSEAGSGSGGLPPITSEDTDVLPE